MANRYNDQDYPRYYDRDDRYDSQTQNRHDDERPQRRTSDSSDRAKNYGNDSARQTRSDEGDYTLYGYERDSRSADRDGDLGSSNQTPPRSQPRREDNNQNQQGFSGQKHYYGQGGNYSGTSESGFENDRARPNRYERDEHDWWQKATDEMASWFGDDDAARRRGQDSRESSGSNRQQNLSGEHRGRGPKNYRRSDERICEEVNDRLTEFAYLDASDIEVSVKDGEATLTGAVESRYAKRMAENIAENVSGINHVENRLRVRQQQIQTNYSAQNQAGYSTANNSMENQKNPADNEFPQSAGTFGSREDLAANYGQQGLVSTTGMEENDTTETETRETNVETMKTLTLNDSPGENEK